MSARSPITTHILDVALGKPAAGVLVTLAKLIGAKQPRFRTATEYVESTLKEAILTGALPGGTPLRQEDLAAEFGLSRMPIREALRQLEAQALVDFYPHRGAVVTEISAAEGADNYAIRAALEPAALRLSAPQLLPVRSHWRPIRRSPAAAISTRRFSRARRPQGSCRSAI